ncbi:conjugal transfer protein TraB [Rodentibacter sp. JRC1]|uniref:TrbI/VirB10 family protein n=1 Tax=Rodentibacter sp. JRC1 TaxID=2874504 RepID=UPI001CFDDEC7|nr:TrbI/VirB10 family protein [Rodentibacter sp. JRC1]GJI56956.1 conjugal transfer protein TraB [Rodentibacter sp. JRC1]
MANNINQLVKNNQRYLWGLILTAIALGGGVIYGVNKWINAPKEDTPQFEEEEKQIEPDLTGAIANTFDGRVTSQVITDAQAESKENREALKKVLDKLDSIENRMTDIEKERDELRKKMDDFSKGQDELFDQVNDVKENPALYNEPLPVTDNGQAAERGRLNSNTNQNPNYQQNGGVISFSDPVSVPKNNSFERKVIKKKNQGGNSTSRFYVPSGAFSNAIVLEGADASAAVTASTTSMAPMQFKLTGELHLPGNHRNKKLSGCFITAGTYGDISSERAIVRTERLSCVINGKHIDQKVKGHVAFYGKNGIKGIPVMRNGKMLGLAFVSGALGGLGNAVSQIGNTQAGLGATRIVEASEVLRQSAGGGISSAANKLADYYIQVAEQYHPVIPIGAGNRVEVVFQEGFWAEFIEAKDSEKSEGMKQQEKELRQDLSGLPDNLQKQLGEVGNQSLNDFVTPNQK